jgi:hypothetical protein
MLHHKADGIAAFATTEALVDLFARRYSKRRSLLVMKRAKPK